MHDVSVSTQATTSGATRRPLDVIDWGRTEYRSALAMQEALVRDRIAGNIGDTLIFTEHEPVYTLGVRLGAEKHLLQSSTEAGSGGIAVVKTTRGGDITYHGPGQVVGYPIIDLSTRRDLHAYLRLLEQTLINTLGMLGLTVELWNPGAIVPGVAGGVAAPTCACTGAHRKRTASSTSSDR